MTYRILNNSLNEIKVLGSRFVGFCCPVNCIEDIENIVSCFKKEYPKADHYPYAYLCNGLSKSSDDGEPSGTAGRQFLDLLNKEKLQNTLVIVARYFGGSKLGVGRLTRTFLDTVKGALSKAKKGILVVSDKYQLELSYSNYEIFKKFSNKNNIIFIDEIFLEDVLVTVVVDKNFKIDEHKIGITIKKTTYLGEVEKVEEI